MLILLGFLLLVHLLVKTCSVEGFEQYGLLGKGNFTFTYKKMSRPKERSNPSSNQSTYSVLYLLYACGQKYIHVCFLNSVGAVYIMVKLPWTTVRNSRSCYFNSTMDALRKYWLPWNKYSIILMTDRSWPVRI